PPAGEGGGRAPASTPGEGSPASDGPLTRSGPEGPNHPLPQGERGRDPNCPPDGWEGLPVTGDDPDDPPGGPKVLRDGGPKTNQPGGCCPAGPRDDASPPSVGEHDLGERAEQRIDLRALLVVELPEPTAGDQGRNPAQDDRVIVQPRP